MSALITNWPISTQMGTAQLGFDQVGNRQEIQPSAPTVTVNTLQTPFIPFPSISGGR